MAWLRDVGEQNQDGPTDARNDWLGTKQAAVHLGINMRTLYRLIDAGEIAAYKFGRVIRLRRCDLENYIQQSRIQPGTLDHLYPESHARPA